MLTVACAFTGDRRATRDGAVVYIREYVEILKSMCERHLTVPHKFRCLTDRPFQEYDVALPHKWPIWWCKIGLFDAFKGPTLYLDLDVVIRGNIDFLYVPGRPFAMWLLENPPKAPGWCSAYMQWDGDFSFISTKFKQRPDHWRNLHKSHAYGKGDQGFIARAVEERMPIADMTVEMPSPPPILHYGGLEKPHRMRDHVVVAEHWR